MQCCAAAQHYAALHLLPCRAITCLKKLQCLTHLTSAAGEQGVEEASQPDCHGAGTQLRLASHCLWLPQRLLTVYNTASSTCLAYGSPISVARARELTSSSE